MRRRAFVVAACTGLVMVGAASLVLAGSVAAKHSALPAGNLVKNPGGEFPTGGGVFTDNIAPSGWTQEGGDTETSSKGVQVVRYGDRQDILDKTVAAAVGGGKNYFFGGYPSKIARIVQTIDVSGAAPEVDAGGVKTCLSAYLGGTTKLGTARVELKFLGEGEAGLGQLRIGPVTPGQRLYKDTLLRRARESTVPKQTRQLQVALIMDGGNNAYTGNYAAADNISVALTKGSCEPVLVVKCVNKALVASVTPSSIARATRVRFMVKGGKGTKQAVDASAPYSSRFTMDGLTGRLTVTANVEQKGGGPITLTKKSRHC